MKENVNGKLEKIGISLEVLVDKISTSLKFGLPELIEKLRSYVIPISQRSPNVKHCSYPKTWLQHMLQIDVKVHVRPIT
jgi:hypothetical protein